MTTDRNLDAALAAWARTDPLSGAGDEAALQRILQHADTLSLSGPATAAFPRHRSRHWLGGLSALAASLLVLAVAGPLLYKAVAPVLNDDIPTVLADSDLDDGQVFALLYTPTNDEEYQL